jgi:hypothetical protein
MPARMHRPLALFTRAPRTLSASQGQELWTFGTGARRERDGAGFVPQKSVESTRSMSARTVVRLRAVPGTPRAFEIAAAFICGRPAPCA